MAIRKREKETRTRWCFSWKGMVRVSVDCQLDRILYHLGNKPPGPSVRITETGSVSEHRSEELSRLV